MTAFALNPTAPTTELEAVNRILAIIGELPIDDVAEASAFNSDVRMAHLALLQHVRNVQVKGWQFNTDEEVTLEPNADGFIILGTGVLRVTLSNPHRSDEKITVRGQKVYDMRAKSFVFDRPIVVDTVTVLPFDELPEPVRMYVLIKAGRQFQGNFVGSDTLHAFSEADERDALILLQEFECDTSNHNFLRDSEDVTMGWADR